MSARRRAFLIGNQLFRSDANLEPLYGPRNDVAAMRRILANPERGGFEVEDFIDKGRDAILPNIEEALFGAQQDDLFLIYYAGHGRLDSAGRLCLATADTRGGAVYTTSIPTRQLCDLIRASRCSTTILILDCCYSGAVGSDLRGDVSSELSLVTGVRGLHALTAATAIEAAKEVEEEQGGFPMGRFTATMVRGIETGAADHDRDGAISVSDLVRYLEKHVRGQTPQYWAHEATGNPVVAHVPAPPSQSRIEPKARASPADRVVQEQRVRRLAYWFKQEKIQREDLDFLMAAALGEADSRVAILVQMILDLPSATPGALLAVWRDSEDRVDPADPAPSAPPPTSPRLPGSLAEPPRAPEAADPFAPPPKPEIDFDALIGDAMPYAGPAPSPRPASEDPFAIDFEPPAGDDPFFGVAVGPVGAKPSSGFIGKYEVRRELSRGSLGAVFDAWDPVVSRRVAIKTARLPDMSDPATTEELDRFRREVAAAGRLSHPNIVGVYDYGESEELAYVVLEYVEGRSLKTLLEGDERLPLPEVTRIMDEILLGLRHSHEQGIIHRDIKPSNVLLTDTGHAKINDFGVARIENSNATQIGTVIGTPAYMSPEQLKAETVDLRTDIYSAGVLLYQLLTGERPFEGSMASIMHKTLNVVPPKPSDLSVVAPVALDKVVFKAMAKDREDRYASAAEFAQAIRTAVDTAFSVPEGPEDRLATVAAFSDALQQSMGASQEATLDPTALAPVSEPASDAGRRGNNLILLLKLFVVAMALATVALVLFFTLGKFHQVPERQAPTGESRPG